MQRAFATILIAAGLALSTRADTGLHPGSVFRSVDDASRIKIASDDELEFTPEREGPNLVCKYSRDGNSLRVVATLLGSPQAIYFKFVPEGLQREGGTVLYDDAHFEAAAKAAAAERERQLAAAPASPPPKPQTSVPSVLSISAAEAFAVAAPRPEYPYEARRMHITGSGVAKLRVDPDSGSVIDATMTQSMGNSILDNAVTSAFRRWRFTPGSVREVRIPITFTMSGASY